MIESPNAKKTACMSDNLGSISITMTTAVKSYTALETMINLLEREKRSLIIGVEPVSSIITLAQAKAVDFYTEQIEDYKKTKAELQKIIDAHLKALQKEGKK